jgi:hypothetical protein
MEMCKKKIVSRLTMKINHDKKKKEQNY